MPKPENTKNRRALIILTTNSTTKLTTKLTTIPKATYRISRRQVKELARRLRKMPKYKTKLYLKKEARIREALKAYYNLSETEITSLQIAAGIFNISYITLYRREQEAKPLSENRGHNTHLNKAQEMSLI
jgi:response regulator RpfG family c-di-GMP phosphodiesterase